MIRFYLTVGAGLVAITAEACSCLAIIWTLASQGEPGFWLGLCLGAAALVPFAAQRVFPRFGTLVAEAPAKVLVFASGFGALCALLLMLAEKSAVGLYVTASLLALTHFLSSQAIEMLFSIAVLDGVVGAATASRMLQVVMTFGGCFGGLVAGTLMDRHGVPSAALAAGVCYAFAGLPMLCLAGAPPVEAAGNYPCPTASKNTRSPEISPSERESLVRQSLIALVACAVSVGCFNVCLPYMASTDRAWSATEFGIIDACGGVGAVFVLLALGGRSLSRPWMMVAPVAFLVTGACMGLTKKAAIAGVFALFWGIAMNIVRARARTAFFYIATDVAQAAAWTSRLVLTRVIAEALAPVVAGLLLDCLTPTKSYLLMMGACGTVILCFSAGLYFRAGAWITLRDKVAASAAS